MQSAGLKFSFRARLQDCHVGPAQEDVLGANPTVVQATYTAM